MSFNFELLIKIRQKNKISRSEFAAVLGISEDRLYRFESGLRLPTVEIIEMAALYAGLPAGAFFEEAGDDALERRAGKPGNVKNMLELINRVNRERFKNKILEERILELEKLTEHQMSSFDLQTKYVDIQNLELSKSEKAKKAAVLARETARLGAIRFDEIAVILRVDRSTLKRWLETEMVSYTCRLFKEKTVTASTPGEAGLRLQCFVCEARANEDCGGYGDIGYPENFSVLIEMLETNGVYSREAQAKILLESYGKELTPHQISEVLSRKKHGKTVPEDIEYLDFRELDQPDKEV
jgi:transcriptional regulator with XRE-family HTH domain